VVRPLEHAAGDVGNSHRVILVRLDGEPLHRRVRGEDTRDLDGEDERLDQIHAEIGDDPGEPAHGRRHPEERARTELRDARGERGVALHEFHDLPERRVLVRQCTRQGRVRARRRRKPVVCADDLAQLGAEHEVAQLERALDRRDEVPGVERLRQELMCDGHRAEHELRVRLTGQHDAHHLGVPLLHAAQQLRAVHARHVHVRNHHVDSLADDERQRLFSGLGEPRFPLQWARRECPAQTTHHQRFVIDEQHPWNLLSRGSLLNHRRP
jgi:hypothetical protein